MLRELDRGRMVLASVNKEIRKPCSEPQGRGGHLVLAVGRDSDGIHFRNPSGHTPSARCGVLPPQVFEWFFAEKGVSVRL